MARRAARYPLRRPLGATDRGPSPTHWGWAVPCRPAFLRHAGGGVRAQPACPCRDPRHRHIGRPRASRRARGAHAARPDAVPHQRAAAAAVSHCAAPAQCHAAGARQGRGVVRGRGGGGGDRALALHRRGRGGARRRRLRAAARGFRLPAGALAQRAARPSRAAEQSAGRVSPILRRCRDRLRARAAPRQGQPQAAPWRRPFDRGPRRARRLRSQ